MLYKGSPRAPMPKLPPSARHSHPARSRVALPSLGSAPVRETSAGSKLGVPKLSGQAGRGDHKRPTELDMPYHGMSCGRSLQYSTLPHSMLILGVQSCQWVKEDSHLRHAHSRWWCTFAWATRALSSSYMHIIMCMTIARCIVRFDSFNAKESVWRSDTLDLRRPAIEIMSEPHFLESTS